MDTSRILTLGDLPMILGFPPSPRTIAQTKVDFPEPLAPTIRFNLFVGFSSISSKVLQVRHTSSLVCII